MLAPRGCWCLTPSPERHPPPLDDSCTQVRMTMDEAVRSGAAIRAPPTSENSGAAIPLDWTAHLDASHAPTFVSGRETYWMAVRCFHYWPDLRALRTLSVAIAGLDLTNHVHNRHCATGVGYSMVFDSGVLFEDISVILASVRVAIALFEEGCSGECIPHLGRLAHLLGLMTRSDMGAHRESCARYDVFNYMSFSHNFPRGVLDPLGLGLSLFRLGAQFQSTPCMMEVLRVKAIQMWAGKVGEGLDLDVVERFILRWEGPISLYQATAAAEDEYGAYGDTAEFGTRASMGRFVLGSAWTPTPVVRLDNYLHAPYQYAFTARNLSLDFANVPVVPVTCDLLIFGDAVDALEGEGCNDPQHDLPNGYSQFVDASAFDIDMNLKACPIVLELGQAYKRTRIG